MERPCAQGISSRTHCMGSTTTPWTRISQCRWGAVEPGVADRADLLPGGDGVTGRTKMADWQ